MSASPAPVPGFAIQMARTTSTGYIATEVTTAPAQMGGSVSNGVAFLFAISERNSEPRQLLVTCAKPRQGRRVVKAHGVLGGILQQGAAVVHLAW